MAGARKIPKELEKSLLDTARAIVLAAGKPLKAREICAILTKNGVPLTKEDLNPVLYRDGAKQQLFANKDGYWAVGAAPPASAPGAKLPTQRPSAVTSPRPVHRAKTSPPTAEAATEPEIINGWPRSGLTLPAAALDQRAIEWTNEQTEVIQQQVGVRSLVIAGPGTGKTAVACARVSRLIEAGVSPSNIMMFSFTRAAVSELRDRIAARAAAGEEDAAAVRITTLDSAAWFLNRGLGDLAKDEAFFKGFSENIEVAAELVRAGGPGLTEYLGRFEHIIVDEAQDLVAERADLVLALLAAISSAAGFTVFADPAQSIYGFTRDDEEDAEAPEEPFVSRLVCQEKALKRFELKVLHRTKDPSLARLFRSARSALTGGSGGQPIVLKVAEAVAQEAPRIEVALEELDLVREELILFRRRSDVLRASSYFSSQREGSARCHRLRLSGFPQAIHPWVGVLLWDWRDSRLTRSDFDARWKERLSDREPADAADAAWRLLFRAAGVARGVDVRRLISLLARPRPPVEFCMQDGGGEGPVLGTIHASKGRQARHVVLMLPSLDSTGTGALDGDEEGRVVYVGATRAQESIRVGKAPTDRYSNSKSGRVYRRINGKMQFEVGRAADFDWESPVATDVIPDAMIARALQDQLAKGIAHAACYAELDRDSGWKRYIVKLEAGDGGPVIGSMPLGFVRDLQAVSSSLGKARKAPPYIRHLVVYGVCTVAVDPDNRQAINRLHDDYQGNGLFLAPLVKGFVATKLQD